MLVCIGAWLGALALLQSPSPAAVPEPPYVLEQGDEISIRIFGHPELEDTVVIRPDGKISLLLLDDLQAAGLSVEQLDDRITTGYSGFYKDPMVTVVVRTFANRSVYLGGEVGRPGLLPLRGKTTALKAVFEAGGFKGSARTDSVILIRDSGEDKPLAIQVDLKEIIEGHQPDIELQPFDILYVPMSRIAKVDKFVDQYIRQLVPLTMTFGFQYLLGKGAVVAVPQ